MSHHFEGDIYKHNQAGWDRWAENGIEWSIPVTPQVIAAARQGDWQVVLTETRAAPREWFLGLKASHLSGLQDGIRGVDMLCLASGGGQQAPVFAAAGARVTVLDASPQQLARDRLVAERDGLELRTVLGDMRDLSMFEDESFDLVFHPVSNVYVPDVLPVWKEAYRVLRFGGALLAGMTNPVLYCFDPELVKQGIYQLKYSLPYSDATSITEEERLQFYGKDEPLQFSHTLEALIGGQLEAGFVLVGFYEDYAREDAIKNYFPSYFATKALKMKAKC